MESQWILEQHQGCGSRQSPGIGGTFSFNRFQRLRPAACGAQPAKPRQGYSVPESLIKNPLGPNDQALALVRRFKFKI